MRVLIVEDEAAIVRFLARGLAAHGHQVVSAANGEDGLALALDPLESVEFVLLDISLPGMDGLEVLRQVRAAPALQGLPVIALTAHAMAGDRDRFLQAGFDAYVAKPITDEAVLLDAIARCFATS